MIINETAKKKNNKKKRNDKLKNPKEKLDPGPNPKYLEYPLEDIPKFDEL